MAYRYPYIIDLESCASLGLGSSRAGENDDGGRVELEALGLSPSALEEANFAISNGDSGDALLEIGPPREIQAECSGTQSFCSFIQSY